MSSSTRSIVDQLVGLVGEVAQLAGSGYYTPRDTKDAAARVISNLAALHEQLREPARDLDELEARLNSSALSATAGSAVDASGDRAAEAPDRVSSAEPASSSVPSLGPDVPAPSQQVDVDGKGPLVSQICFGHRVQSNTCSRTTPMWCNRCRVWFDDEPALKWMPATGETPSETARQLDRNAVDNAKGRSSAEAPGDVAAQSTGPSHPPAAAVVDGEGHLSAAYAGMELRGLVAELQRRLVGEDLLRRRIAELEQQLERGT